MRPGAIGRPRRPPCSTAPSRSCPDSSPTACSTAVPTACTTWRRWSGRVGAIPPSGFSARPLCDRELHGLNAGLRIPAGSSGGLVIGGARYMRLWEVLDAYWRPGRMA